MHDYVHSACVGEERKAMLHPNFVFGVCYGGYHSRKKILQTCYYQIFFMFFLNNTYLFIVFAGWPISTASFRTVLATTRSASSAAGWSMPAIVGCWTRMPIRRLCQQPPHRHLVAAGALLPHRQHRWSPSSSSRVFDYTWRSLPPNVAGTICTCTMGIVSIHRCWPYLGTCPCGERGRSEASDQFS